MDNFVIIFIFVVAYLIALAILKIRQKIQETKTMNSDHHRMLAELELSVWQFPINDFKALTEESGIFPPIGKDKGLYDKTRDVIVRMLKSRDIPEKYHSQFTSDKQIDTYFAEVEKMTRDDVICALQDNFDKIENEKVSSNAGYQKARILMTDILQNERIPVCYHEKFLSREVMISCIDEVKSILKKKKEIEEANRIANIKQKEIYKAERLSQNLTHTGKEKLSYFVKKQIEYLKFKIAECNEEIDIINGRATRRAQMFNHESNTWAYHGGIASAIAGPAAGVVMATEAKKRDDARNALNAQLYALNIQLKIEQERKVNEQKEAFEKDLDKWKKALEAIKYQLEERKNPDLLLKSINPQVTNYKVSETGTVTLEVKFSKPKNLLIYGEKPAYVDGSVQVKFVKNGNVCGRAICYLPYEGTSSNVTVKCMCTSLPKLDDNEEYGIEFSPNSLWAMESSKEINDVIFWANSYDYDDALDWYYKKNKKNKISDSKNVDDNQDDNCQNNEKAIKNHSAVEEKTNQFKQEDLDKHRKKTKKSTIKISVITSSALIACLILINIIIPSIKYNTADKHLSEGNYEDATEIYESLGNYKDSHEKMLESLLLSGNFEEYVNKCGQNEIVIPAVITKIPDGAFKNCTNITSIVIPKGVTSIGDSAFYGCENLTSITIPDSVTNIGSNAFYNCYNLTSLTIPDKVTSIGNQAFWCCSKLSNIVIPDSVTYIGDKAFIYCHNLTKITIPNSVTTIGESAFCGCSKLTSVIIGNGVTSIDWGVFSDCSSLTSITIPNSVTSIGGSAFKNCSSLTSITIPDSVTSIGSSAFKNCSSLTSITIPDSVTSIGEGAFSGCSSLENMVLPFIGDSLNTLSNNKQYPLGYIFGTSRSPGSEKTKQRIYDTLESYTTEEYYIPSSLKNVTITGGNITNSAFWNCTNIENVIIGDGISSIGYAAFYECSSLANITIPESVTSIDDYAFYGCSDLTHIVIPNTVTCIGEAAFYECSSLVNITIPESVASIDDYAFYGCSDLANISIPDSVTSIGTYAFGGCTNLTKIIIPNNVIQIGYSAFYGCSSLESITLPFVGGSRKTASDTYQYPLGYIFGEENYDGSVKISQYYHYKSTSSRVFSSFYIPETLKNVTITGGNILSGAFDDCVMLNSVVIGDSVTNYIDDYTFRGCSNLISIVIGDGVTSIGDFAFNCCSSLTNVVIGDGVTSIGDFAFNNCNSLTNVVIGDGVTYIGKHAFASCSSLTSVVIGDSVTCIEEKAFSDCYKLTSVVIPKSVTNIGEYAFSSCRVLTAYCEAVAVPSGWNLRWNKISYGDINTIKIVWGYNPDKQ